MIHGGRGSVTHELWLRDIALIRPGLRALGFRPSPIAHAGISTEKDWRALRQMAEIENRGRWLAVWALLQ